MALQKIEYLFSGREESNYKANRPGRVNIACA